MKRHWLIGGVCVAAMCWLVTCARAAGDGALATTQATGGDSTATHGLAPLALVGVALLLVAAKLGGEVCERYGQPAVLGELAAGIVLGNLTLVGFGAFEPFKTDATISALAELGVIVLLFEVGLESNLSEMLEVGWSSLLVACAGVIAPFFLGWGVAAYFIPDAPRLAHIFIGATLCATSVGITARVLKDMGRLQAREARIILGAAVIDDVLGLVILAVVQGAIAATGAGATLSWLSVALIALKAAAFLLGALLCGRYVVPQLFRGAGRLEGRGVLLALAVSFCLLLAWTANYIGLAYIVGAFAAGLVLDEAHFEHLPDHTKHDLHELLRPVSSLLVPLFFVLMGLRVDLRAFARLDLLGFAAVLTVAAIIGKQVCSLAVVGGQKINRLAVGIGMVPRGEVGLIFAGIGATLMLPGADGKLAPVIAPGTFGVVIVMVIITTLITPPLLKFTLTRKRATQPTD